MRHLKQPRCGPCCDMDHGSCVVLFQFGTPKLGRPEKHKGIYRHQKAGPYIWRCGCWCEWAKGTKCLKCEMCGVAVDKDMHCVDQVRCFEVQSLNLKLSVADDEVAS